jgi:hypothetical protein
MADEKNEILRFAAQKAAKDAFFLASALTTFKEAEKLSDSELADYLEISETALVSLALCRRPFTKDNQSFRTGITEISTKFELSSTNLINLLRRAEMYEQSLNAIIPLIAARDREEDED